VAGSGTCAPPPPPGVGFILALAPFVSPLKLDHRKILGVYEILTSKVGADSKCKCSGFAVGNTFAGGASPKSIRDVDVTISTI